MQEEYQHKPVLLDVVISVFSYFKDLKDPVFVDGTIGLGGHSMAFALQYKKSNIKYKIIAIDKDQEALKIARKRTTENGLTEHFVFINDRFENIKPILNDLKIGAVDGMLLDLGVSSMQLDDGKRGFSFQTDAPLDMRMDQGQDLTAKDIINRYSEKELVRIFSEYGEERFSKTIARKIVEARSKQAIETTKELSDLIVSAIPGKYKVDSRLRGNDKEGRGNDKKSGNDKGGKSLATNVFRALRMEVNREVADLEEGIISAVSVLPTAGKLAVITFHSIEDRIVKQTFSKLQNPCTCPLRQPVCVCGLKPQIRILDKKPIVPTEEEIAENPRARSAKLRIVEKI